jgi:hypothetical protein
LDLAHYATTSGVFRAVDGIDEDQRNGSMNKFTGTILALDLATTTGWAFGRPDRAPKYGSIRFGKPGADRALCYRIFRTWLDHDLPMPPDLIVYESPASPMIMMGRTNINTIKRLIGLCENLEEWACDKVELREASVQQVRAHFIGRNLKSAMAKAATIARCRELGWDVNNDNEGDACALWDYQRCCLRPDIAVTTTPLFERN